MGKFFRFKFKFENISSEKMILCSGILQSCTAHGERRTLLHCEALTYLSKQSMKSPFTILNLAMAMKKHIAVFNVAEAGHLNPGLGLMTKLSKNHHHQVTGVISHIAGDDALMASAQRKVEATGASFVNHFEIDGVDTEEVLQALASFPPMPEIRMTAVTMRMCTKATIEWIKANKVDIVVFGHYAPVAYVAAKVLNLPAICIFTQVPFREQKYCVQAHQNFQGKPGMSWMDIPPVASSLQTIQSDFGVDIRNSINPMRKMWFKDTPTIVYSIPELSDLEADEVAKWVTFAGVNPRAQLETDHVLVKQAKEWKAQSPDNKVMVATLGTIAMGALFGLYSDFLSSTFWPTMRAVAIAHPELMIVLGLGNEARVEDFNKYIQTTEGCPKNFVPCGYLPQLELLDVADIAFVHGGCGSVHESLRVACPLILFPLFGDQPENSAACVNAGLGVEFPSEGKPVPGSPKPAAERACFNKDAMKAAIEKCLTMPKEKLLDVSGKIRALEAANADVKAVLSMLKE